MTRPLHAFPRDLPDQDEFEPALRADEPFADTDKETWRPPRMTDSGVIRRRDLVGGMQVVRNECDTLWALAGPLAHKIGVR